MSEEITESKNNVQIPEQKPEPVKILNCVMSALQFQEITKTIASLNPECQFLINADGIETMFVDVANVAMLHLNYKASAFEMFKYSLTPDVPTTKIGIDITQWKNFSKLVKKGMLVQFELTQYQKVQTPEQKAKSEKIELFYRYVLSCNGNVQTIDALDTNTMRKMPNIAFLDSLALDTKINIYASEFIETVKAVKDIDDHIVFLVNESGFMACSGHDTAKFRKQISIVGKTGPEVKVTFSNDYLVDFVKSIQNKKEIIQIDLKTDMVIRINMSDNDRDIMFALAPRVDQN